MSVGSQAVGSMGLRARGSAWPGCRSVPGIAAPIVGEHAERECLPSDIHAGCLPALAERLIGCGISVRRLPVIPFVDDRSEEPLDPVERRGLQENGRLVLQRVFKPKRFVSGVRSLAGPRA